MQRISHLIRVHPDETTLNPCVETMEIIDIPGRATTPERGLHAGQSEFQEWAGAADLHLHQKRLAFVYRHTQRVTHRLIAPCFGQSDFV